MISKENAMSIARANKHNDPWGTKAPLVEAIEDLTTQLGRLQEHSAELLRENHQYSNALRQLYLELRKMHEKAFEPMVDCLAGGSLSWKTERVLETETIEYTVRYYVRMMDLRDQLSDRIFPEVLHQLTHQLANKLLHEALKKVKVHIGADIRY